MFLGTKQKANQRTEKDKCNNSSKSFQCVLNEEFNFHHLPLLLASVEVMIKEECKDDSNNPEEVIKGVMR